MPRFHRDHRKRAKRGWEQRDKRPRAETEVHRGRQTLEASSGLIALAAATMPPFWRSMADLWSSYLPISIQRCTEAWQRLPRRFDEAPRACPKRGPTNPWKRRWNLRQRFAIIPTSELDENGPRYHGSIVGKRQSNLFFLNFVEIFTITVYLASIKKTFCIYSYIIITFLYNIYNFYIIVTLYYYIHAKNVGEICALVRMTIYLNFWPWWKLKRQICASTSRSGPSINLPANQCQLIYETTTHRVAKRSPNPD